MFPIRTSIFYFNDIHGNDDKLGRLKTAADSFSQTRNSPGIDTFKLTGGDVMKGANVQENGMWVEFMNRIGLDASAIGNHELDQGAANFNNVAVKANFPYISTNAKINPNGALGPAVKSGHIVSSWVANKNGHLYGFVGLAPVDQKYKKPGGSFSTPDIQTIDVPSTIAELQKGVNQLQKAGINKIIMVSHYWDKENIIPAKVSGIDVIISGHKHNVYKGLVPGQNYFLSPAGEPVVKAEAGKDGKYNGVLDLVFDRNGRIIAANNDLKETKDMPDDLSVITLKQKHGLYKNPLGMLNETVTSDAALANFVADAVRKKAHSDVALVHTGGISSALEKGIVTESEVRKVLPYKNTVSTVQLSENQLAEILKKDPTIQAAGFEHKKKDGQYTVAMDNFLINQISHLTVKEKYPWSMADATMEGIKGLRYMPFSIKPDGKTQVGNPNPFVSAMQ